MSEPSVAVPPSSVAHEARGLRAVAIRLLAAVVRAWCRTIRFELAEEDRVHAHHPGPVLALLWHNRLFFVPWTVRRIRPGRTVVALVSASRDGAALSCFFERLGLRCARGSSSRMGREALHEVIGELRRGRDVAITPDGPRGPRYEMKAGALLASRRSGVPLLLLGVRYGCAWRLRSWDRFEVPAPFTRARVRCALLHPGELPPGAEALAFIRSRLLELNGEPADAPLTTAPGNGSRR